jgi:hypothetical protein
MNFHDNNAELRSTLAKIGRQVDQPFNPEHHNSKLRGEITTLFLKWYFGLIAGSFAFSAIYNFLAGLLNYHYTQNNPINYLDVSNTVSIVTTTLSSGVGFVIGYYFKNKNDEN